MNKVISVNMKLHYVVIRLDTTPKEVRYYNAVEGVTANSNLDADFPWSKHSKALDDVRLAEEFICQNQAVMAGRYIEDWTPSTNVGDYVNYTSEMLECLLGIYLSEFQKPETNRVTDNYHLDISDASNGTIDIANSPNANAIKDLFVAAGKVFSVKSN